MTDFIEAGIAKVNIADIFSLQQAKEAFVAKENHQVLGKIAIEVKKALM